MKIALVTTTINVPHVLRLYRRCDPDVRFFVGIDKKTPAWTPDFTASLQPVVPVWGEDWACSEPIGWNSIQRRNIATLEALRWGADFIVSVDDDNIPTNRNYFFDHLRLDSPFCGLLAHPETDWFDIGAFLDPPASHRGFPHQHAGRRPRLSHVVDARIGVCAGIVMGDPDIAAMTRIVQAPHVLNVSPLLNSGIAVNPRHTWTVFNSQNTAIVRDLAPAFCMLSGVGRYDDIFASLIMQRVMRDTGHHVLFGPPFVYQERNIQDLQRNISDEMLGMRHTIDFADWLDGLDLSTTSVLDAVRGVFTLMSALDWMPQQTREAGLAWVSDCEKVL